jgi:hypothetical protein
MLGRLLYPPEESIMKRLMPLLLVVVAGSALACPDAAKNADAKAYDKMARVAPAMSPAPDAKPVAAQLAKRPVAAKTAAAAETPAKKPAGG